MSTMPDSTLANPEEIIADLRRQLAERTVERDEALAQQTASTEVLGVINSSPGNVAPVFSAILEKAHTLCGAAHGHLSVYDGQHFRAVATHGVPESFAALLRQPFRPGLDVGKRLLAGEMVIHIHDMATLPYEPEDRIGRGAVELGGARTLLIVALRKDATLLGYLTAHRTEVRPFSNKQIALLQNFAAQAVIAIENSRLITETREALEQQTATAEVLGVINASPGDLAPVFDAMLEKAHNLCGIAQGSLELYDGQRFRAVACRGLSDSFAEILQKGYPASDNPATQPLIEGERFSYIPDLTAADYSVERTAAETEGIRSLLCVPLRRERHLLGMIASARREIRPFTEKEIALLENFAAQAVIAMENARLITETREALEQQTATAEVLGVINAAPGDLAPVFEAMLQKALRLCDGSSGTLQSYDGTHFHVLAVRGPSEFEEWGRQLGPLDPAPGTTLANLVQGERVVQVTDMAESEGYRTGASYRRGMVDIGGFRSILTVALHRDEALVGALHLYSKEARRFTDKQIALLQNFAAQAVIAMENARLITETREALEQQTATAEVLGVINSSPGDLAPVFDAMLEKAMDLCEAAFGQLWTYDGDCFEMVTSRGVPAEYAEFVRGRQRLSAGTAHGRMLAGERVVHVVDLAAEHLYQSGDQHRRATVDVAGARSLLGVALVHDEKFLGVLIIYRQEVRAFSDKQIALLQNFAAQAVIAIENARLITETREALDQQTATAEVLGVINASPGELAPVFNAILEKAHELCGVAYGTLQLREGDMFQAVAAHGLPSALADRLRSGYRPNPHNPVSGLLKGADIVHIPDLAKIDDPTAQLVAAQAGIRSTLHVALRKDDILLGQIISARSEVRPFTESEINLLKSFAAQAVIAIENARLITETREALEQQTATAEVLGVINSSRDNLAPVFDVLLDKALHLSKAAFGALMLHEGDDRHRVVAMRGAPATRVEFWTKEPLYLGPGTAAYRHVRGERRPMQVIDAAERELYQQGHPLWRTMVDDDGVRTWLAIPLHKDSLLLGTLIAFRREVQPFSEKQIAILQGFAAQAVIAIENARLLHEVQQRQAELRVTFDNMGDGVVMFDAEHRLAAWNRNFQELLDLPDSVLAERPNYADYLRVLAERGEFGTDDVEAELARRLRDTDQELRLERERPDGRVIEVRRNAVPDGGFVLIYSDITERKRSEAEIRAARDAAEAAYRDLQAAQANLVQAQKMAALGQLTAGIAHEIKNPLNFVNNFASLSNELLEELKEETEPALAALDDDKRAEIDETMVMLSGNLEKIVEHGQRADNIVKSMLEHSRGVSGERREVDLNGLIEEALNLAYHGARAHDQDFNISLERDYAGSLKPIELAPQEITRVFLNLFGNGFYAANKRAQENGASSFRPILAVATRDSDEAVEVRVRDNGTGILPEIKDKLFQPFFTTKPTGEGTGLGLSISYDIITQQHGGTITVESEPGAFTEFTVCLPRR